MAGFKMDDYVDVAQRINEFYERFPEGSAPLAGTGVVVHLDNYSRKVEDDFNPDGYPINRRTTPEHDTGGYGPDDPKGWAA